MVTNGIISEKRTNLCDFQPFDLEPGSYDLEQGHQYFSVLLTYPYRFYKEKSDWLFLTVKCY